MQEGDSTSEKLSGSIINALIFVGAVALMTFILVLLFKYGVRLAQRPAACSASLQGVGGLAANCHHLLAALDSDAICWVMSRVM